MNIVYWFTFTDRVKNKTPPYYYIGSKHDCTFINGVIFDNRNIEYWSSCEQERFLNAISLQNPMLKYYMYVITFLMKKNFIINIMMLLNQNCFIIYLLLPVNLVVLVKMLLDLERKILNIIVKEYQNS